MIKRGAKAGEFKLKTYRDIQILDIKIKYNEKLIKIEETKDKPDQKKINKWLENIEIHEKEKKED
jgi:hypothetical protein